MNIARSIRIESKSGNRLSAFAFKLGIALSLVIGLIGIPATGFSQTSTTGQISGSVVDESGSAVPAATVTLKRAEVGFETSTTTSDEGNFTFAKIPVGTYELGIKKEGFKESTIRNVVVNVSSVTNQIVTLEVGGVNEVVVVTADAVQIETQTGTVGEVVTGEQVRELPLNGRSFVQLTQLQPGVSAANNLDSKSKGLFGGVDFSVNGNSAQSNLFLTDGANNNDTGSNRTILLFPSIEAIAEFKTLRNAFGPEYGQAAGAVISIVTRGGSNGFHGTLYYFGRNDALNATDFFANATGQDKAIVRRNDFGGAIGGPIVKDKLFFFYSQEFNKEIRGQARFGSVPTVAERGGDFSNPRFDSNGNPCSGPPIGNGQPGELTQIIPQADLSPAGLALVEIYPLPNLTNTGTCVNWAASANSPIDFREENIRIDYNVNSKNRIFGRYTQDTWTNASPILVGNLWGDDAFPTIESSWAQPSKQLALKLTTEISSTAINEVQFSYSGNRIRVDPGQGGDLNRNINTNLPGFYPDSDKVNGLDRPHPVFWGGIAPYFSNSGSDLWTQSPFRNALDIYSIRDDFSMVKGNHTFKMGFLYDRSAKDEDSGPNNETTQFWGACCSNNSGNYLADILTRGSRFGFGESNTQAVGQTRYSNLEFYFGDSFKVRPNITVELGVRYSLFKEPYDNRDRISSFSPDAYDPTRPATDPCNGLVVPNGTNPCSGIAGASTPIEFSNRALRENDTNNFAPRLGFAWDVFSDGRTAIRAGFGQFFLRERVSPVFAALTQNSPFVSTIGGQRTLDGPPIFDGLGAASNGSPRFGFSPEAATPYSLQFNFSVGQQLWKDAAIEIGYVGNRARDQLTHSDVNQVLEQNRLQAAFAPDANAVNAFRPYSNYGSIYLFERNGRADYDSLQFLFRTRLTNKSQFQAAYTYSRSQADFGLNDSNGGSSDFAVLDRNNRGLDFAKSDINRPHIFVANAIYNLPTFRDKNVAVQTLLGGWELASIMTFSSGTSLTPRINATGINNLQAGITGLGTGVANQRPLRVEDQPCTLSNGQAGAFINPAAFTLVGYEIGGAIPRKTTCLGPPTKNVDFSIYKNFTPGWLTKSPLGEEARIQFRLEMFNAFNTTQFRGDSLPLLFYNGGVQCGANPCSPTNNVITQAGAAGNFGQAGSTRGPREIQYALKLIF